MSTSKKSKKIIFLNPPIKVAKPMVNYPNCAFLGVLANASVIKKHGFDVEIIDSFLMKNPYKDYKNFWKYGGDNEKEIVKTLNSKLWHWLIIGYNCFNHTLPFSKTPTKKILEGIKKKKNQKIILSDCHISSDIYVQYNPLALLEKERKIDFVCTRETENKILSIMKDKPIAGVAYKKRGGYYFKESQGENQPLIFDFDLIEVKKYLQFLSYIPKRMYFNPSDSYFPLLSSRGCNFNCAFCTQEKKRAWQPYPLNQLKKWIEQLKQEGVKKIVFLDLIPNFQPQRFGKILDFLYQNHIKATFPNGMRGDFLNKKLVQKAAKCMDEITISIESGSKQIRESVIKKRLGLKKISVVLKEAARQNLKVYSNFIIGLPKETKEQINTTLDLTWHLFKKFGVIPKIEFIVPIRGAPIYNQYKLKRRFRHIYFKTEPYAQGEHFTKQELKKFLTSSELRLKRATSPSFVLDLKNLPEAKAKQYIKKLARIAMLRREREGGKYKQVLRLIIKGVEPLVYPHFLEVLARATRVGFEEIYLITNGQALAKPEVMESIARYNVVPTILFYDIRPTLHDRITKVKGSFKQNLQSLINLKQYRKKVRINFLLTAGNWRYLENLYLFCKKFGVKDLNIFYLAPANSEILEKLKRFIKKVKILSFRLKIFNLAYCFIPEYENLLINEKEMINDEFCDEIVKLSNWYPKSKGKICKSCPYNCICEGFIK